MNSENIIESIFTPFQESINCEQDVREEIRNIMKDIEKPLREIITTLQIIHRSQMGEEGTLRERQ
jgi:IMP dehydrogenase/GMP reductase